MKFAGVFITLFALLLLGGCGGGGGGGDSTTDAAPVYGGATGIEAVSVSSDSIGIVGGSATSTAVIKFEIHDSADVLVPDGRRVDFSLLLQPMGGEALSVTEDYTVDGSVTVKLTSGTASGPVDVQASYYDEETGQTWTTVVRITIVSGASDAQRLSISAPLPHSMDGTVFNLEKEIVINLGDRYGNVVPDGTPVSFMTEGGTIGLSSGFNTSTTSGVASATLRTANPTTPDLGGVDPMGNVGLCRIVAYTSGAESYQDNNGNGKYDDGIDTFITRSDMSEPYIDANDSGSYESGEMYVDSNGDGVFTPKNGVFDSNTTIWTSMNIVFSSGIALNLGTNTESWTIGLTGTKNFTFVVSDAYGNTPLDGTTYSIDITTENANAEIKNESPTSPLTDLNGQEKVVSFTLVTDSADAGDITIKVTATLPDGTEVTGDYKGKIQ